MGNVPPTCVIGLGYWVRMRRDLAGSPVSVGPGPGMRVLGTCTFSPGNVFLHTIFCFFLFFSITGSFFVGEMIFFRVSSYVYIFGNIVFLLTQRTITNP